MPKNNKRKESNEESEIVKFFNIKLKTEKELNKLSEDQKKQYLCRLKRWDSCLETELDFQKYKTKALIDYNNALIDSTIKTIEDIKSDDKIQTQFEKKYGKKLVEIEEEIEDCIKGLKDDKEVFFNKFWNQKKIVVKEEIEEKVEIKPDLKKVKKEIKTEIKQEFDYKPNIKKEFKVEVKDEEDMDYEDIKPDIKQEIKTEYNTNGVKVEVLTSDEEDVDY